MLSACRVNVLVCTCISSQQLQWVYYLLQVKILMMVVSRCVVILCILCLAVSTSCRVWMSKGLRPISNISLWRPVNWCMQGTTIFKVHLIGVSSSYLLFPSSFFFVSFKLPKNHSKDLIARVSITRVLGSLPTFLQYTQ